MTATDPISPALKNDNWDLHQIAERTSSLMGMVRGEHGKDAYIAMIEQHLPVAEALDAAVRAACAVCPEVDAIVEDDQYFATKIRDDLAFFGRDPGAIEQTPGTRRYVEHINQHAGDAMHVFGLHYVRRGACNGNKYVAMKLRPVLGLPETGEGTNLLDPFGNDQRTKWDAFKTALDATPWTDDQRAGIVAGVRSAYLYAINWEHDEHRSAEDLLAQFAGTLDKGEFDRAHEVVTKPHAPARTPANA